MLDFRVKTFLNVCKTLSFTKTAAELCITQPAISQHIKYLENLYNTKLFTYENKHLKLTQEGEYLRKNLYILEHDSIKLKDELSKINKRKFIYVGTTFLMGEYYLPERLPKCLTHYPDLDIKVIISDVNNIMQLLNEGKIDLAICEGHFNKEEYDYKFIKNEKISVFAGIDYNIKQNCKLEDLFEHRILVREETSSTREIFDNFMKDNNYTINSFKKYCCFNSPNLIEKMLLANQGISFLYNIVGEKYLKEGLLKEIKLPNFNLYHEYNAIWCKKGIYNDFYHKFIEILTT